MLLSLLVYSLTGASLFYLGWHVNKREQQLLLNGGKHLPFYSWEIVLSLLLFACVAGARYHTGYDHAMYLEQYQHLLKTGEFSRTNFEYGFEWISQFFALIKAHYFFYFAFWALLQIGFLYYGLRYHKHLLCWVGLGIMCGTYFLGWMNSMRQGVVVCLFVAILPLINNKKFLPYAAIVIASAFIHKSALLLLPVFLLAFLNIENRKLNRWWMLAIFAIFVLLGAKPFWLDWFTNYQWFLNITGYENYGNINDPNVGGTFRTMNWGPGRLSIFFSNVFMIWFYPELKTHFKDDKLLPLCFVLAYVGMCLSNLVMNTSHFILRPLDYFVLFYLIMAAYLMVYFIKTKKIALAIVFFMLFYSHFIISVYKAVFIPKDVTLPFLYHFFFAPKF